jgi:hypothetical protein
MRTLVLILFAFNIIEITQAQKETETASVVFEYKTDALNGIVTQKGFYERFSEAKVSGNINAHYKLYQTKNKLTVDIQIVIINDSIDIQCNDIKTLYKVIRISKNDFTPINNSFGYHSIEIYCDSAKGIRILRNINNNKYYLLSLQYSQPDNPKNITTLKFELPETGK